ncbi:MAG: hypothetical protein QGF67_13325, partial [Lentisphaeria bacterium]|nr:hypothetical protein [Lentisphaeria bacterium]
MQKMRRYRVVGQALKDGRASGFSRQLAGFKRNPRPIADQPRDFFAIRPVASHFDRPSTDIVLSRLQKNHKRKKPAADSRSTAGFLRHQAGRQPLRP